MTTKAEKRHMDKVAQLPCATCGAMPVELHHAREEQDMNFYMRLKAIRRAQKKHAEIKRLLVKAKDATKTKAL